MSPVGGAFVLYLEDDYQEPDSISASDVYFVVQHGANGDAVNDGQQAPGCTPPRPPRSTPTITSPRTRRTSTSAWLFARHVHDRHGRTARATGRPDESGDTITHGGPEERRHQEPLGRGHSQHRLPDPFWPRRRCSQRRPRRAIQPFNKTYETCCAPGPRSSISDVDNSRGYEMTVTGMHDSFNGRHHRRCVYVKANPRTVSRPQITGKLLDCEGMKNLIGSDDNDGNCFRLQPRPGKHDLHPRVGNA